MSGWSCQTCTYYNSNSEFLTCSICKSIRSALGSEVAGLDSSCAALQQPMKKKRTKFGSITSEGDGCDSDGLVSHASTSASAGSPAGGKDRVISPIRDLRAPSAADPTPNTNLSPNPVPGHSSSSKGATPESAWPPFPKVRRGGGRAGKAVVGGRRHAKGSSEASKSDNRGGSGSGSGSYGSYGRRVFGQSTVRHRQAGKRSVGLMWQIVQHGRWMALYKAGEAE
jgi:hypothetical protein